LLIPEGQLDSLYINWVFSIELPHQQFSSAKVSSIQFNYTTLLTHAPVLACINSDPHQQSINVDWLFEHNGTIVSSTHAFVLAVIFVVPQIQSKEFKPFVHYSTTTLLKHNPVFANNVVVPHQQFTVVSELFTHVSIWALF